MTDPTQTEPWKLIALCLFVGAFLWLAQSHSHAMDLIADVQVVQAKRTETLEAQRRKDDAAHQDLRERMIRMETQLEHIARAVGADKGGE